MKLTCRACTSNDLGEILNLGMMPSVGGFLNSQSEFNSDPVYPLNIHVCEKCSLVQIVNPIDPNILFKNYSFSSSTVKPLIDHFKAYALWLQKVIGPKKVFEFGCNDGILLEQLNLLGINSMGIDISENITEMARKKNLNVMTGFFNVNSSMEAFNEFGSFDIVTGSNAFAHNQNPTEILEAAKVILTKDGSFCLEVMYAGDLLQKFQWDTLYHEHLTFYSLGTLEVILKNSGFYIYDAESIPMHGGSLRIAASLNANKEKSENYMLLKNQELISKLNEPETWKNFGKDAQRKISIVRDVFASLKNKYSIGAYGAAGKAAMWFNSCGMNYLEYVVDESPLRAGKYMPGTHTPIVFPDFFKANPVDLVFISAWNYSGVISKKENWYKGIWVVPLPDLTFF
jgi:D-mycarose 3-C-methyltransferase